MLHRRVLGFLALLLLAACGGDGLVSTTSTTTVSGSSTVPTVATTTTIPTELEWSRLPDDAAALGGPGEQRIAFVTAAGPGFVAVGAEAVDDDPDAAIWTSADGSTWSRVPHDEALFGGASSQGINGAAASGAGVVAVGSDYAVTPDSASTAAVWTSPDGITWSRVPNDESVFGGDGSQIMMSVVAGGPGFVAVGWDAFGGDETDAAVWLSEDGFTWTRVAHDEATLGGDGRQTMAWVTVFDGTLVAVGWDESGGDFDAAVWTSADGATWTRVAHDEASLGGDDAQRMRFVLAGGPGLIALGSDAANDGDGAIWTSADGVSWTRVAEESLGGPESQSLQAVAVGGPGLVAVGSEYLQATDEEVGVVWTSTDGASWERYDDPDLFGGGGYRWLRTLVAIPGGLLAGGGDGLGGDYDAAFWTLLPAD